MQMLLALNYIVNEVSLATQFVSVWNFFTLITCRIWIMGYVLSPILLIRTTLKKSQIAAYTVSEPIMYFIRQATFILNLLRLKN